MSINFGSFMLGFGLGGLTCTVVLLYVLWDEDRKNKAIRDVWKRHADNAVELEATLQARVLEVQALIKELEGGRV